MPTRTDPVEYESGSVWHRWDPHIHAPGTLLNDQFAGDWDGFIDAINRASPMAEILGITDYFSIASYRAVRKLYLDGRLPKVKLVFPNVELRIDMATERKRPINVHLLFSPDDPDHEEKIEQVLTRLSFEYQGRQYACTTDGLTALGRAHNPTQKDAISARSEGANQFKVTVDKLRELFRNDTWVAQNCLVAVCTNSTDGTAGLQKDASFSAWRKEVERLASLMFSGNPKTRDFWLGRGGLDRTALEREYGGRKACLHGCDAHEVAKVLAPDEERYCWIKGDPTFEALRQTLLEPDERVWVGRTSPSRHDSGSCIAEVSTASTDWLSNRAIRLNPGLVAIIGSRGSGKTALADLLAAGANVDSPRLLESSFLHRASHPVNHLKRALVKLTWGNDFTATRSLNPDEATDWDDEAAEGVRYLSQQFVEQLCSSAGLALELRQEIERVIFEATDPTERLDADSFEQLADIHLEPIRADRREIQESIQRISSQIVAEDSLHNRLEVLKKEQDTLQLRIAKTRADMLALMPKGQEERAKRLAALEAALATATTGVDKLKRARVRVEDLQRSVARMRAEAFPQHLAKLKSDFHEVGLMPTEWQTFAITFSGDVEQVLTARLSALDREIRRLTQDDPDAQIDVSTAPSAAWPQQILLKERDKAREAVGIDSQKQRRYADLQRALEKDERSVQRATTDLEHAKGAAHRKQELADRRRKLYQEVFQTYLEEQTVLTRLYGPLQEHLEHAKGSLSRLRFTVSREVDLNLWVEAGERLFDLRKESALRGHGALRREAEKWLLRPWKLGKADEVATAMQNFIQELYPEFQKSRPSTVLPAQAAEWMQQVAAWVYSTDHIQTRYSVTYDGVAIEHLSPGTRGIVLLLLYLVIDRHDRRPLIIDQPEENLDPQSVFDELVPHFRDARRRRQVIIVTHNANLVVNTDVDQVIVASSVPKGGAGLPTLSYKAGSLENPEIRKAVCDILEGGERAFLDRERRYRLHWDRPQ